MYMASLVRILCSSLGSCTILLYFILNLSFAFVELSYGIWANSLAHIMDSFHMLFDCSGLMVGIVAAAIARAQWKPNIKYTYGYGRVDAIANIVNSICLLFIAFLLSFEAGRRLYMEVPPVKSEGMLYLSIAGLCVNVIGTVIVYSNTPRRRLQRQIMAPGYIQDTTEESRHVMLGLLLHVISDAMGSIGVIMTCVLIEKFNMFIADPICAFVIGGLVLIGITPLLRDSIDILMQRSPRELDDVLSLYVEKIAQLLNVLKVKDPNFWTLHNGYYVASLRLEVHHSITRLDKDALIWAVKEILAERGFKKITVEVEDIINFDKLPTI